MKHVNRKFPGLAECVGDLAKVYAQNQEFLQQLQDKWAELDLAISEGTHTEKQVRNVFLRLAKSLEASRVNLEVVAKVIFHQF